MAAGDTTPRRPDEMLRHAELTDTGMRRSNNQDSHSFIVADSMELWRERGHLFLVADGMGAHAAGELASKISAETVPHLYHKHRELSPPEALQKAIIEANTEIHRRGEANADFHNMGTTTSVLVLVPQGAIVAHVGDSRIYRYRRGQIQQLTFDHSLVWELRASGKVTQGSDLAAAVPKNVITRSLGPNGKVQVDVEGPHPLELGDSFLLCSDGLSGQVPDEEIGAVLASMPPEEAARLLIDLANLRGGPDNSTCLIAQVADPALTTAASNPEPLKVGVDPARPKAHPAIWVVGAACLLAALVMLIGKYPIPAGVAAVGGIVAFLIAWAQHSGGFGAQGVAIGGDRRLGKGPYTNTACAPTREFVLQLASIADEMRAAADEEQWDLDRKPFNDHCRKAAEALDGKRLGEAVRHYGLGISYLLAQLRKRGIRRHDDSSIHH